MNRNNHIKLSKKMLTFFLSLEDESNHACWAESFGRVYTSYLIDPLQKALYEVMSDERPLRDLASMNEVLEPFYKALKKSIECVIQGKDDDSHDAFFEAKKFFADCEFYAVQLNLAGRWQGVKE